ncbi:histidine kinase [Variovorax sp. dw_954]|uniref:sensor histidine kinase n=1 Tax=Variovorax sp. dw_954 TaxID=2720078 RepID=UPI001BD349C2|nr:histidine kinase [Variovorax sp. dw_954]
MNIRWRDAARHFLQIAAFCCAIAVLTTLIWPSLGYARQVGYALSNGIVAWLVIEFGRYFFDPRNCHSDSSGGHGWPKGWRGLLLATIGISCGFFFGGGIANFLFGTGQVGSSRDTIISVVITAMAGTVVTFYFHARGRAAALTAQINAAERDASEARLKLLETQLEPHMLFNTLANLRVLITTDPQRAVAMLDRLNSYLRATLSGSRALAHPLSAEFDLLRDYLELMSVRMGERLQYTLDLPDYLRDAAVPPLLLQPLVENAIQHGLEPKVGGGSIVVRARRQGAGSDARLVLEVNDTGVGLSQHASTLDEPGRGFGLTQVRERLASTYGDRGAITLAPAGSGGTCAAATLPLG